MAVAKRRPEPVPIEEMTSRNAATRRSAPLTVTRPELLVDGSDDRFRQLVHSLFGFLARHEAVRNGHAARIGLAGIEYTVLISIAHLSKKGDVSVKAVADHLRVSGTFVTRTVSRLVQLGLVSKMIQPDDRRHVRLTVSTRGRERLEELAPVQREVNDVEFGCVTQAEFLLLADVIERLIKTSEKAVALQVYLAPVPGARECTAFRPGTADGPDGCSPS